MKTNNELYFHQEPEQGICQETVDTFFQSAIQAFVSEILNDPQ